MLQICLWSSAARRRAGNRMISCETALIRGATGYLRTKSGYNLRRFAGAPMPTQASLVEACREALHLRGFSVKAAGRSARSLGMNIAPHAVRAGV